MWKAHVAGEPDELRALKLIDVAEASSDERGRLRREAEAIHRLNNKSIVRCHGMVEDYDGGWLALILDWIDGEPLSQAQDREDMTAAQRRAIVRHLAHALAYLHGLGVLHRDIKASNVMLRPQFWEDARDPQNVVLVDFGIAVSWLDEDHERRLAIGTVSHMAPELLDPSLADGSAMSGPATDVFSFGVLAWRLFTREHPLGSDGSGAGTAKSYAEAYGLVARGVRAWPVAASPPPPALEEVFTRCLAVRPAERARSGGEVAQLIEGARAGAGGTPEPPRVQGTPPREASARTPGSTTGSTTTATVSTVPDRGASGAHARPPYSWARRAMAAALAVLSLSVAGVSFARHREGLEWRDWLFVDLERGDGWLARSDRYRQAGNPRAAAAAWRHAASAAGDPALVKRDQALRFARTLSPHTNEVVKLWQLPRAIDVVAAPGERDQGFASVEAASVAVIGVPSVTDRKEVWFLVLIPLVSSSGKRQSHWYATAAQLGVAPNAKELAERCHRQVSGGIVDDVEATCKRAVFTADPDILASVASDLAVAYASNRTEPAAIEWLLTSYDAKPAAETGTRMAELCARTRGPAGSDGRSYRAIGWRWLVNNIVIEVPVNRAFTCVPDHAKRALPGSLVSTRPTKRGSGSPNVGSRGIIEVALQSAAGPETPPLGSASFPSERRTTHALTRQSERKEIP